MTIVWICLAVIAGLLGTCWLIGLAVPVGHSATVRARFAATPTDVWRHIAGFAEQSRWRKGLASVERLDDRDGKEVWQETDRWGKRMAFCVEEREEERRLVTRIVAAPGPFGGSWTFELEPDGDATSVRITEDGEIYSAIFRTLARFVFGYSATMRGYLRGLGRALGQEPVFSPA